MIVQEKIVESKHQKKQIAEVRFFFVFFCSLLETQGEMSTLKVMLHGTIFNYDF